VCKPGGPHRDWLSDIGTCSGDLSGIIAVVLLACNSMGPADRASHCCDGLLQPLHSAMLVEDVAAG